MEDIENLYPVASFSKILEPLCKYSNSKMIILEFSL
jgi:hypothetical protein